MAARFIPQSKQASTTARSLERTSYLNKYRSPLEAAFLDYFESDPRGEQVTLAAFRVLKPRLKKDVNGALPDAFKQDIGLFVAIVLSDLVGPENVETYRDPKSGRGSARAVPARWADLRDVIARYTPHRLTPQGLTALRVRLARAQKANSK